MKKFIIWFRAVFLDYRYYRVVYKDGRDTHLLYRSEAEGLRDIFKGKMYIDYSVET